MIFFLSFLGKFEGNSDRFESLWRVNVSKNSRGNSPVHNKLETSLNSSVNVSDFIEIPSKTSVTFRLSSL
jgi:hypothetical protein